jgi:large subunit ribosomal protein L10e
MAKKRKFIAYRRLERPYTRKSKYRELSFIRATPANRIIRFNMGDQTKPYNYKLLLCAGSDLQIRDISLESCRLMINRHFEKKVGGKDYYIVVRVYPHHHLRENALASGAGADRLSTGMKFSFGKVIGLAARIYKDQPIIEARVFTKHLDVAKKILQTASSKLPCGTNIVVEKLDN